MSFKGGGFLDVVGHDEHERRYIPTKRMGMVSLKADLDMLIAGTNVSTTRILDGLRTDNDNVGEWLCLIRWHSLRSFAEIELITSRAFRRLP